MNSAPARQGGIGNQSGNEKLREQVQTSNKDGVVARSRRHFCPYDRLGVFRSDADAAEPIHSLGTSGAGKTRYSSTSSKFQRLKFRFGTRPGRRERRTERRRIFSRIGRPSLSMVDAASPGMGRFNGELYGTAQAFVEEHAVQTGRGSGH